MPIKLLILGSPNGYYNLKLLEAGTKHGCDVCIEPFSALTGFIDSPGQNGQSEDASQTLMLATETGLKFNNFDAVIVRSMPAASLEQVVYRMDSLQAAYRQGVDIINPPKALECAIDKWLTLCRLKEHGVNVPPTYVSEITEHAMHAYEQLGGDVVVKPLFGSEGRGLMHVDHPEMAWRTFKNLEQLGAVIYLQKFLKTDRGDLRLFVWENEVLGAMKRHNTHDFRTNATQNGIAELHKPLAHEVDIAVRATQVTGCIMAGVDLIYDEQGKLYVLEVNAVPGWKYLEKVLGFSFAEKIIQRIYQRINRK